MISLNPNEAWLQSPPKNYHYVRFCFSTEQMRSDALCLVKEAIGLWAAALGGHASEQNDHGLVIKEVVDDKTRSIICHKPGTVDARTQHGEWVDGLSNDTLAIWVIEDDEDNDEATIEYVKEFVNGDAGRHFLNISRDTINEKHAGRVAHEIGHVLGMGHEHQRKDRKEHIHYDCKVVRGYTDAAQRFRTENPGKPDSDRCDNLQTAKKYNKFLTAFTTNHYADVGKEFDFESIMLYDSTTGADDGACERDILRCPLLKVARSKNGEQLGLERFQKNWKPSKGDAEFVHDNYRFKAPERGTRPDVPPKPSSLRATQTFPPHPLPSQTPKPGPPPLSPRPTS